MTIPFGSIKQWMGQGAFLTCQLGNVRGEFSLNALAYNTGRAINLVGIPALIDDVFCNRVTGEPRGVGWRRLDRAQEG